MYAHEREFVLVDLPGLIEGAAEGVGLGDRFLGHAERTKLIIHVVDGTELDVAERYKTIRNEMELYGGGLIDKPEIIVLNKIDAMEEQEITDKTKALKKAAKRGTVIVPISAAGAINLEDLKKAIESKMTE
jgi:GTP-binding protein